MTRDGEWQPEDDSDARAEFYEEHLVPAVFAEWALLSADAARVSPGQRVLDAACGTGIVARIAEARIAGRAAVTGIDLSKSTLKVARRLCPDVNWQQGNVMSMPFADGSFDVVLYQAAFPLFPDQVAALREMRRVLCPGGTVAVQAFGAMPVAFGIACDALGMVAGEEVADVLRSVFRLGDTSDLKSQFARAGFQSATLRTHRVSARYSSIKAFVNAHVVFLTGRRADADAVLSLARDELEPFRVASGAMHIPIEGYIITALKGWR